MPTLAKALGGQLLALSRPLFVCALLLIDLGEYQSVARWLSFNNSRAKEFNSHSTARRRRRRRGRKKGEVNGASKPVITLAIIRLYCCKEKRDFCGQQVASSGQ